jgi:hypothetical protein
LNVSKVNFSPGRMLHVAKEVVKEAAADVPAHAAAEQQNAAVMRHVSAVNPAAFTWGQAQRLHCG